MKVSISNILFFIVLNFLAVILNGYVLTKLWGWFIVPTFNLPVLQVAPAIGIALIIKYLTYTNTGKLVADDDDEELWIAVGALLGAFFIPLSALFFGWILTQFM